MLRKQHSIQQLKESMRLLLALINDGKISPKKQLELQEEYCFLERDYELLITKR